jgi:alpha-L-fucosidase 2
LPSVWKEGHVKGLIARGNFEIEMWWNKGKLSKAFITSKKGGNCRLRADRPVVVTGTKQFREIPGSGKQNYLTSFNTIPGKRYEIKVSE